MPRKPEEIDAEDCGEVVERVSRDRCRQGLGQGLYASAASQHPGPAGHQGLGRRRHHRRDHGTRRGARRQGIERVVVESTSDYWRPFVYLLEARGLLIWLVNARDVKQVPGRPKTDKLDAVWLASSTSAACCDPASSRRSRSASCVTTPGCGPISSRERTRHKQRVEKLLEDSLIKLSTVATDIFGKSGRAMLDALIAGERDPDALAELALGKLRSKRPRPQRGADRAFRRTPRRPDRDAARSGRRAHRQDRHAHAGR